MPTPVSVVSLPTDVKLLVLDYIRLKRDLKALCLVSKEWRSIATTRLYEQIIIEVYDNNVVAKFMRCFGNGAAAHLQYIRSLIIVNMMPPTEGYAFLGDIRSPRQNTTLMQRDQSTKLILELLPRNSIHTFRFISVTNLDHNCLATLQKNQPSLRHIHCVMDSALDKHTFPHLETMEIELGVDKIRHQKNETMCLSVINMLFYPRLRRLRLQWTLPTMEENWKDRLTKATIPAPHSQLRELSLHRINLSSGFSSLSKVFDFPVLTKLILRQCKSTDIFLSDFARSIPDQALHLTKFAVLNRRHDEINGEAAMGSVQKIVKACKLTDLHLSWPDLSSGDFTLGNALSPRLSNELRSFSLSCSDIESFECHPPVNGVTVDSFLNLKQLAINVDGELEITRSEQFPVPLCHLSNIRILHIRKPKVAFTEVFGVKQTAKQAAICAQAFATKLLQSIDANKICPKLKFLVIGTHGHSDNDPDADMILISKR